MRSAALWLAISAVAVALSARSVGQDPDGADLPLQAAPRPATTDHGANHFVPNRGQWDPQVRFGAVGPGRARAWFVDDGWTLRAERFARASGSPHGAVVQSGSVVRMEFEGGGATPTAEGPLAKAVYNFLLGDDPTRWATGLRGVERLLYRDIVPGVDVRIRPISGDGTADPRQVFEYDLLVRDPVDLAGVRIRCHGADSLWLDHDGALHMELPLPSSEPDIAAGTLTLVQSAPVAWFEGGSGVVPVPCAFSILEQGPDGSVFGFELAPDGVPSGAVGMDPSATLVVDPGIVWSSYLGGGASDAAFATDWQPGGGVVIGGWAGSNDFPTVPGAFRRVGGTDAFVARIADGGNQLMFSTYLGGGRADELRGLKIAPGGEIIVCGWTNSANFPTTPGAFQPTFGGRSSLLALGDGFVCRMAADGTALRWSTFIGGEFDDMAMAVDVAPVTEEIAIAGWTTSPSFPVTPGVFKEVLSSPNLLLPDGFVIRMAPDGSAVRWSTLLGGSDSEELRSVTIDSAGQVTVAGYANSSDALGMQASAFQSSMRGIGDGYVARIGANGRFLVWSTYLGGMGFDDINDLSVYPDGRVLVVGATRSPDQPVTPGALQRELQGDRDGFITMIAANGRAVEWSSFFGGPGVDVVRGVAVDAVGEIYMVGESGGGLPVTAGALQAQFGGGVFDGFAVRLDPTGQQVLYATYLGGSQEDYLMGVAVSPQGTAALGGYTFSDDVPVTAGAVQPSAAGVSDALAAQIDPITRLSGSLTVAERSLVGGSFSAGEQVAVLGFTLTNTTRRAVLFRRLDLVIAGTGDNLRDLAGVRLYFDRNGDGLLDGGDVLVAGPLGIASDNATVALAFPGTTVNAAGSLDFLVVLDTRPVCAEGAEFAVAVESFDGWDLQPTGVNGGPELPLTGAGFLLGPVVVCGAQVPFPGDFDGDGGWGASDLRQLATVLGQSAGAGDIDGDGVITAVDLEHLVARVLGQPVVLNAALDRAAGALWTLGGYGLDGAGAGGGGPRNLRAAVDGMPIPVVIATDREAVLRLPTALAAGFYQIELYAGARRAVRVPLTVR